MRDQTVRELLRNIEITSAGAVVPDGGGRRADAERRHEFVSETLVVVGAEDDDQVRIEGIDERSGVIEGGLDPPRHRFAWVADPQ